MTAPIEYKSPVNDTLLKLDNLTKRVRGGLVPISGFEASQLIDVVIEYVDLVSDIRDLAQKVLEFSYAGKLPDDKTITMLEDLAGMQRKQDRTDLNTKKSKG